MKNLRQTKPSIAIPCEKLYSYLTHSSQSHLLSYISPLLGISLSCPWFAQGHNEAWRNSMAGVAQVRSRCLWGGFSVLCMSSRNHRSNYNRPAAEECLKMYVKHSLGIQETRGLCFQLFFVFAVWIWTQLSITKYTGQKISCWVLEGVYPSSQWDARRLDIKMLISLYHLSPVLCKSNLFRSSYKDLNSGLRYLNYKTVLRVVLGGET